MAETKYSRLGENLEPPIISDLMAQAIKNPDILSIAAGFTDNAILPNRLLSDQIQALLQNNKSNDVLQYGTTKGREKLRTLILEHLQSFPDENRSLPISQVLISNGSQQSLYLAMQVLCNPGDIILVEDPSYFVFLEMLRGLNIQAIGLPSDHSGKTDIEKSRALLGDLKKQGKKDRIRGLYLVSYYSNPSSRSLPLHEKEAFLSLLEEFQLEIPIIEDAAYRDLYYENPHEAPSILNIAHPEKHPVLYTSTFTKPLATGLKVGYAISNSEEWIQKMTYAKGHHDFGSAHFNQALIEQILAKNLYLGLLKKQQIHYLEKSRIMSNAMEASGIRELGWTWQEPRGGLLIWLIDPQERVDTDMGSEFCNACLKAGVLYVPGSLCFANKTPKNAMRLSFGTLTPDKLVTATERLCKIIKDFCA